MGRKLEQKVTMRLVDGSPRESIWYSIKYTKEKVVLKDQFLLIT